jgi:hypothetical protein
MLHRICDAETQVELRKLAAEFVEQRSRATRRSRASIRLCQIIHNPDVLSEPGARHEMPNTTTITAISLA